MCTNYNINTKVNIQISTKSRYRRTKMFVKRHFLKTFEIETQTQIQDTNTDIGKNTNKKVKIGWIQNNNRVPTFEIAHYESPINLKSKSAINLNLASIFNPNLSATMLQKYLSPSNIKSHFLFLFVSKILPWDFFPSFIVSLRRQRPFFCRAPAFN